MYQVNDRLERLSWSYLIFLFFIFSVMEVKQIVRTVTFCCATSSAKRNTEFFGTWPFDDSKIAPLLFQRGNGLSPTKMTHNT